MQEQSLAVLYTCQLLSQTRLIQMSVLTCHADSWELLYLWFGGASIVRDNGRAARSRVPQ